MIPALFGDSVERLATAAFPALVDAVLKATCLLLAAGLIMPLLRRRPAALRHAVWTTTLGLLLALPLLSAALPGWRVLPDWLALGATAAPAEHIDEVTRTLEASGQLAPTAEAGWDSEAVPPSTIELAAGDNVPAPMPPAIVAPSTEMLPAEPALAASAPTGPGSPGATVRHYLLAIWLLGVGGWTLRMALSAWALQRCGRRAELVWDGVTRTPPASGSLAGEFDQLHRELGAPRRVRILLGDERAMPMAWGVWRSCVLVPRGIEQWPAAQRRAVLLHELGHIVRRDPLWQVLVQVAQAVYWFHPLVWLAGWRIHVERERACDDLVLNRGVAAPDYARHLLDVVSGGRLRRVGPALGVEMASTGRLEGRVRSILDGRLDRRPLTGRVLAASVIACIAVGLPLAMMRGADRGANDAAAPERDTSQAAADDVTQAAASTPDPDLTAGPIDLSGFDPKLADIISAVMEQEQRYANLETVIQTEQNYAPAKWTIPKSTETVRTIRQGRLLFVEGEAVDSLARGGEIGHRFASAFDGRRSVSVEYGDSANVHDRRYEPSQVFPPHTWGLFHLEVNFPLSVYLAGTNAMEGHPKVRRLAVERGSAFEFYKVECEAAGSERVGEFDCEKVRVRRWYYTKDEPAIQYLWLAPARNYLCIKAQMMARLQENNLPVSESVVEEFREVAPGLWFPQRVRALYYDYESLRQGKLVPYSTRTLVLERAAPDPAYVAGQFQLSIPEEVPVYAIGPRGVVDTPHHPQPAAPERSTTLDEILAGIRRNEALYENLDITVEERYFKPWLSNESIDGNGRETFSYVNRTRSVTLDGRHYVRDEREQMREDRTPYTTATITATDGEWQRQISTSNEADPDKVVLRWAGLTRISDTSIRRNRAHALIFDPHDDLFEQNLSEYLVSELRDKRNSYRHAIEYEGDDAIDGLLCHRLRIDNLSGQERRVSSSRYVWLCRDRNLLPIRTQWLEHWWHATLITGMSTVDEWRELKPDVWLPVRWTHVAFKKFDFAGVCENRLIHNWRKDYRVESVSLHPQSEQDLFNSITVPAGTEIFVNHAGKTIGSYMQARDGGIEISPEQWSELLKKDSQTKEGNATPAPAAPADSGKADGKPPAGETAGASTAVPQRPKEGNYVFPLDISGRALDRAGKPIVGAVIFLGSQRADWKRISETTTDEQGRYEFVQVPLPIERATTNGGRDVGAFEVFGFADGHAIAWRPKKWFYPDPQARDRNVEDDPDDPPTRFVAGEEIELDLTFDRPVSLSGRIVDDRGQPIPDTELDIRYADTEWDRPDYSTIQFRGALSALNERETVPPEFKRRKTDADGRFTYTGLRPDCRYSIWVRPPGFPLKRVWVVTHPGKAQDENAQPIYGDGMELAFTTPVDVPVQVVYADTGEPAPRVMVHLGSVDASSNQSSDAEGRVTLRVPPGMGKLQLNPAHGTPYLVTDGELVVPATKPEQALVVRLRRAAEVEVTVVDAETGAALPNVDLWRETEIPQPDGRPAVRSRNLHHFRSWEVETRIAHVNRPRTDGEGRLRALFEPGQHRIGVGMDSYPAGYEVVEAAGQVVDCRAGETVKVTFRMRRR